MTAESASKYVLSADQKFKTESKEIIPGMTVDAIVAKDIQARPITAIPYFARAYRKETSMSVWVGQAGLKTGAETAGWDGLLYRPLDAKTLAK